MPRAARARVAGIGGRVSGHSLRVGNAQSLAAAGASLVEMQREGRWKSPEMPSLYTRNQAARRGATARLPYKESGGWVILLRSSQKEGNLCSKVTSLFFNGLSAAQSGGPFVGGRGYLMLVTPGGAWPSGVFQRL